MQRRNYIYFSLLFLIFSFSSSLSNNFEIFNKDFYNINSSKFRVELEFSYHSASGFYDSNSTFQSRFFFQDTINQSWGDTSLIFTQTANVPSLFISYIPFEKTFIYARIPFEFWSLEHQTKRSKYTLDEYGYSVIDYTETVQMPNLSRNIFANSQFGINSLILDDNDFALVGKAQVTIPSGGNDGLYSDASNTFLSDGAFMGLIETKFLIKGTTTNLLINAGYEIRGEDFSDIINIGANIYFSNVESTMLILGLNYFQSTQSVNRRPISIYETVAAEDYLNANLGFYADLSEKTYAIARYTIKMFGTTTLSTNSLSFNLGVKF